VRLAAIATAGGLIKATSFTIDGEAVVLGSDGLSRRGAARTTILYAFDLIELDGEDLRRRPFLDRKAALSLLLGDLKAGLLLTNTSPKMEGRLQLYAGNRAEKSPRPAFDGSLRMPIWAWVPPAAAPAADIKFFLFLELNVNCSGWEAARACL
jgi:hypothetical protein